MRDEAQSGGARRFCISGKTARSGARDMSEPRRRVKTAVHDAQAVGYS